MSNRRDGQQRIAFPIQLFGEDQSFAQLPDEIRVVPGRDQRAGWGSAEGA